MEELGRIIQTEFTISNYYTETDGTPVFVLPSNQETKASFKRLSEKLQKQNLIATLHYSSQPRRENTPPPPRESGKTERPLVLKVFPKMEEKKRKSPLWNLALLIATVCTVTLTGYWWEEEYNWFGVLVSFLSGPWYGWFTDPALLITSYTIALLSIVGLHELGHYLTSRRRGVDASLPFFIPGIPPIGTFGAVIFQRSPTTNRDELFDIGLMGPVTGFIIAFFVALLSVEISPLIYPNVLYDILQLEYQLSLPVLNFLVNVYNSSPALAFLLGQYLWNPPYWPVMIIGPSPFVEPLLFSIIIPLLKPETAFSSFFVSPLYWAAWVGFLVTALNLFPVGMFDGGHMCRAILSRRTHYIASIIVAIIMMTISYMYIIMAVLALLTIRRTGHPGALDDVSPLTTSRKVIFILMMIVLVITLPPLGWSLPTAF